MCYTMHLGVLLHLLLLRKSLITGCTKNKFKDYQKKITKKENKKKKKLSLEWHPGKKKTQKVDERVRMTTALAI